MSSIRLFRIKSRLDDGSPHLSLSTREPWSRAKQSSRVCPTTLMLKYHRDSMAPKHLLTRGRTAQVRNEYAANSKMWHKASCPIASIGIWRAAQQKKLNKMFKSVILTKKSRLCTKKRWLKKSTVLAWCSLNSKKNIMADKEIGFNLIKDWPTTKIHSDELLYFFWRRLIFFSSLENKKKDNFYFLEKKCGRVPTKFVAKIYHRQTLVLNVS